MEKLLDTTGSNGHHRTKNSLGPKTTGPGNTKKETLDPMNHAADRLYFYFYWVYTYFYTRGLSMA